MGGEGADGVKSKQWSSPNRDYKAKDEDPGLWGIFLFGLIGATATTFALVRSKSSRGGGSFRTSFQEEAWRRYNRRMQEEHEEEMERVERIRRMQSVFNRERNKYKRSYESWKENGPGAYHQHFQRDDWYWKADASYRDQQTNYRPPQRDSVCYPLSHHYMVLGLDRARTKPYTEDEIKTAFRAKAKEFHPDQNQDNKEVAEAKFKEVMTSYEAIKQERKKTRV
ncbi:hypothetical protein like AT4G07990 [Hibiscus trionum]|uniref:J domain-containing protein n=1 Tax=Hibiscus trionum TaxID=183268 RepID=A0A9W7HI44_HIBTR|nr:hypothetical protein like AT4G07990 [Hibiscus trionum]